jgi:hypothetical protein
MTMQVANVDRITPYKEIAHLLAEHKISAAPVLTMGRHVAGVQMARTATPLRPTSTPR